MRNCLHTPRFLLPRRELEQWAAPDGLGFSQGLERPAADQPSALHLILPENGESGETDALIERMYAALEDEWLEKIARGMILVERAKGDAVRRGILGCLDLEGYTMSEGEVSLARATAPYDRERTARIMELRKRAPIEIASTVMFYRDKKNKILRSLPPEDMEELYDFDLGGERLRGYYIPDDVAAEVAEDLHSRGEPCFLTADGGDELAAAKLHWEEVKKTLDPSALPSHPARFAMAEFVNVLDPAQPVRALNRLVSETEADALLDWLPRQIKCRREGKTVRILSRDPVSACRKTDALLASFLRQDGGRVEYLADEDETVRRAAGEDCVGILLPAIEREDFFSYWKDGALLPHFFAYGSPAERRYCNEAREITYD